jgi:hypothetical protein
MDHADKYLYGGLPDDVIVLAHPRPMGMVWAPFQLDQADILGNF